MQTTIRFAKEGTYVGDFGTEAIVHKAKSVVHPWVRSLATLWNKHERQSQVRIAGVQAKQREMPSLKKI